MSERRIEMGMNPETNKLEPLHEKAVRDLVKEAKQAQGSKMLESFKAQLEGKESVLVRPDGSPVPKQWAVFRIGEKVVLKNYTFMIAGIGEHSLLLEPVGPVMVGQVDDDK